MATEIKLTGDSVRILAKIGRWPKAVNDEVKNELDAIGQDVRSRIMENMRNTKRSSKSYGKRAHRPSEPGSPPAVDSGKLFGSFEVLTTRRSVEVGTNVIYAKFLEGGSAAHKIEAKRKKGLSEGKGGIYFGPIVNHPGIKPRPFLKGGYEGIKIDERLKAAIIRGAK
jgi:phage gpG-like protein